MKILKETENAKVCKYDNPEELLKRLNELSHQASEALSLLISTNHSMHNQYFSMMINDPCPENFHTMNAITIQSAKLIEAWAVTSDIYDETSEALKTNDRKSN